MSLKRFADKIGYSGIFGVAIEALWKVPSRPEPPSVYADQVWAEGLPKDLSGKTFAITGTARGMGNELAKQIASRGGNLILLNRKSAHAAKTLTEIEQLNTAGYTIAVECDLCNFESVTCAAALVRKQTKELDALVLNAGLMAQDDGRTGDGFDIQMQANHLSHFLLTSLLLDVLEKTAAGPRGEARIVSHSSGAREGPPLAGDSFETAWVDPLPDGKPSPFKGEKGMAKWNRYQQSKRANLAFTYALQDLLEKRGATGVKALCAHPGATNSGLQSHTKGSSWLDNFINGLAVVCGQSKPSMAKVPSLAGQSSPRTPAHLAIFGSGPLYAL